MILAALEAETLAFGKPVVLVHGDSHSFQINKPLFGSKSKRRIKTLPESRHSVHPMYWLRASVNFKDPNVFNKGVEENLSRSSVVADGGFSFFELPRSIIFSSVGQLNSQSIPSIRSSTS